MRLNSAKLRGWGGGTALTVVALVVAVLGLVAIQGDVRAAGTFDPQVDVEVSTTDKGVPVDLTTTFNVLNRDYQYQTLIAFNPKSFWPDEPAVPLGDGAGQIKATSTLGLVNGPCGNGLPVTINLFYASTDTSDTITFDQQFVGDNGVNQYPDFLTRMFPGLTPVERLFGKTTAAGQNVSLNIVTFEAGALGQSAALGRPSVTVLNDIGDPGSEPTPGETISDFCTPLLSKVSLLGETDPSGAVLRNNPTCGENPFVFSWYTESMPDADGDGIENYLDTCPFDVNTDESPRDGNGPDLDGIDTACESALRASDPGWNPANPCWPGAPGIAPGGQSTDCDGDGFMNRGDNCPLDANADQADADADSIGNACDTRGNGTTTVDGVPIVLTPDDLQVPINIDDIEACPAAGVTATPTPTPTATAAGTGTATVTGTATATGTATPTTVAGEGCAPVIPGTYNGLVRLNGVPAAPGYEVTASIEGTEWGSTIVSGGRYALDVPQKLPSAEPCFAGGTITFTINGATCEPTEEWASGLHDVDLSCAAVATPTVAPPSTPPPATPPPATPPPATPAKPPVTGGGGLGGDQGLPLWAMVAIGWAGLTALAGLGTLATRRAKR